DHVAAFAAVTPVRASARLKGLAAKAHATRSAVTAGNSNGGFIDKTHEIRFLKNNKSTGALMRRVLLLVLRILNLGKEIKQTVPRAPRSAYAYGRNARKSRRRRSSRRA